MEVFQNCKLQIGLLLIIMLVSYSFIVEGNKLNQRTKSVRCNPYFDWLFILGGIAMVFDGTTAFMVCHLDIIPPIVNNICHLIYLLSYQGFIFVHFLYWLYVTDSLPQTLWKKVFYYAPIVITCVLTVVFIPKIYYEIGAYTNFSQGAPVVACFSAIIFYEVFTLIISLTKSNYIQKNKRTAFIAALTAVCIITLIQVGLHEMLVAPIAVAVVIISIYLNMENPTIKYLEYYHDEMVTGFATLVESKDGSTGGHISRSSAYAVLIAKQLRREGKYKNEINKDYIDTLQKAAPMHDIGKIAIPDGILQKPGKLTKEEYVIMQKHPEIGGGIIKRTFGHLDDDEYENMAYQIAMYHHEKWNGKGYPNHLEKREIPLCARIMAVADVFDAVSAERCYRAAMPLETCYQIILDGRGEDFDPEIVDAFMAEKKSVEEIYSSSRANV